MFDQTVFPRFAVVFLSKRKYVSIKNFPHSGNQLAPLI